MHAFLITGANVLARKQKIEHELTARAVLSFDRVTIEKIEEHITIEQVRSISERIWLKPLGSSHAVLVMSAHTMTLQAQNALLKTLEEPPPNTFLYLETQSASLLLPTIVSRCQITDLGITAPVQNLHEPVLLLEMTEQSAGKRVLYVDSISTTKEDATAWVDGAIQSLHPLLLKQQNDQITSLVRRLLVAHKQLMVNVNTKLVLDTVFTQTA